MLLAVAGKVDLTPPPDVAVPLIGFNDTAYTDPKKLPADVPSLRPEKIYARILLLQEESGANRVALVTLDCCRAIEVPVTVRDIHGVGTMVYSATLPAGATAAWAAAAGLRERPERLSLHATHTHYAPAVDRTQANEIEDMIRVLAGGTDWQPVTVHGGVVPSTLPVSRIPGYETSDIDRTLIALDFRKAGGGSVARLINLGVHGTSTSVTALPSPDFIGRAMNLLEEDGSISLFLQGWSGDVGPCNGEKSHSIRTYTKMKELADTFVAESRRAIAGATEYRADTLRVLAPPVQYFTPNRSDVDRAVTFRGIAIGTEILIVAVSGEIFQDYGPILTSFLKRKVFMPSCGLANGYSGYIPTTDGFRNRKGYETNTTPFLDSTAETEMRAGFRLLFDLFEQG